METEVEEDVHIRLQSGLGQVSGGGNRRHETRPFELDRGFFSPRC